MKRKVLFLVIVFVLFATYRVSARVVNENEFKSFNIKRSYVLCNYVFDVGKHNPTLKDFLLASQSCPIDDVSIYEIKYGQDINGNNQTSYTDLLNNIKLSEFPTLDIRYIFYGEIKPKNHDIENKIVLWDEYIVTFDSNGGTPVSNQKVVAGELAKEPPHPTKENRTFLGWSTSNPDNICAEAFINNGTDKWDFNTPIRYNWTLNAVWGNRVTVDTYDIDTGTYDVGSMLYSYNYGRKEHFTTFSKMFAEVEIGIYKPITIDIQSSGNYQLVEIRKDSIDGPVVEFEIPYRIKIAQHLNSDLHFYAIYKRRSNYMRY